MTEETKKARKPRTKKLSEDSVKTNLMASLNKEIVSNKETLAKPIDGVPYVEVLDHHSKKVTSKVNLSAFKQWCDDNGEPYDVVSNILTRPYLHHNSYSYHLVEPDGSLFEDVKGG